MAARKTPQDTMRLEKWLCCLSFAGNVFTLLQHLRWNREPSAHEKKQVRVWKRQEQSAAAMYLPTLLARCLVKGCWEKSRGAGMPYSSQHSRHDQWLWESEPIGCIFLLEGNPKCTSLRLPHHRVNSEPELGCALLPGEFLILVTFFYANK